MAVIQLLRPSLEAKLVRLPPDSTLNWKTEWQDEDRKKWHEYKMATKVEEKFDFLRPKGAKNQIFRVNCEMREKI